MLTHDQISRLRKVVDFGGMCSFSMCGPSCPIYRRCSTGYPFSNEAKVAAAMLALGEVRLVPPTGDILKDMESGYRCRICKGIPAENSCVCGGG